MIFEETAYRELFALTFGRTARTHTHNSRIISGNNNNNYYTTIHHQKHDKKRRANLTQAQTMNKKHHRASACVRTKATSVHWMTCERVPHNAIKNTELNWTWKALSFSLASPEQLTNTTNTILRATTVAPQDFWSEGFAALYLVCWYVVLYRCIFAGFVSRRARCSSVSDLDLYISSFEPANKNSILRLEYWFVIMF